MAEEWRGMALRVWPEMARVDNPITEGEFMSWVQRQLEVFEASVPTVEGSERS